MRILLVDDEVMALHILENAVKAVSSGDQIIAVTSAEDAYKVAESRKIDVAFLDVDMPKESGLSLAESLKELWPRINIIMVTSHPQYALDALQLFVSGYIVKPYTKEAVQNALMNLRNPVQKPRDGLYVQCFGNFEVFYHGEPVRFKRSQAKEIFAYLVDLYGATATNAELRAMLWGDEAEDSDKQRNYLTQLIRELRLTLEGIGCEAVFQQSRNAYGIKVSEIVCDYYEALENDLQGLKNFRGEYMKQYEWAEDRVGYLSDKLESVKRM